MCILEFSFSTHLKIFPKSGNKWGGGLTPILFFISYAITREKIYVTSVKLTLSLIDICPKFLSEKSNVVNIFGPRQSPYFNL